MLTGNVPFQGTSDYQTFQKIIERNLIYPSDYKLSDNAKDLIDKLLQLNPQSRLGAGLEGSSLDYQSLKSHPFFDGIDFNTLETLPIPVEKLYDENGDDKSTKSTSSERAS